MRLRLNVQSLDGLDFDDDGTIDDQVEALLAKGTTTMEHDDFEFFIESEARDF